MYKLIKEFPKLYSKSRSGEVKTHQILVQEYEGNGYIQCIWCNKENGKEQSSVKYIRETNVGKSNYKKSLDQALVEAENLFNSKKKRRFVEKLEDLSGIELLMPLPKLLKNYDKYKDRLDYPCYVSVKHDGIRMLQSNTYGMWSRAGFLFNPDLLKHLKIDCSFGGEEYILDGEVQLPGGFSTDAESAITHETENTKKLTYTVFDIISPLDFKDRYEIYEKIVKRANNKSVLSGEYKLIESEEEGDKFYEDIITQGKEGIVYVNNQVGYEIGQRTSNVLKRKPLNDAEFEVIGIDTDAKGLGLFLVINSEGKKFTVQAKNTVEYKKNMVKNQQNYVGKMLKVQFNDYNVNGIPKNARALGIREEFDLLS